MPGLIMAIADHTKLMEICIAADKLGKLLCDFAYGITPEIEAKLPHVIPVLHRLLVVLTEFQDANEIPGHEGEMNALAEWNNRR
jgi:hypothetical protein